MNSVTGAEMHVDRNGLQPHCPACGRMLECLGSEDTARGELAIGPTHAYVCPAGCRGQTSDGTFIFVECPVCGSHDTSRGPQLNGCEELICNVCGAIVTMQLHLG